MNRLLLTVCVLAGCGVQTQAPLAEARAVQVSTDVLQGGTGDIHYRFVDASGQVSEGTVSDPSAVRFEFLENGASRPQTVYARGRSVNLALPAVAGTLELHRAGGAPTMVELSAEETASLTQPLGTQADVLGAPVRIATRSAPGPELVIVPEGFTTAELPAFRQLAQTVAARLVQQPSLAPYVTRIGVVTQDVRSVESGIDIPPGLINDVTQQPIPAQTRNTAFDITLNYMNSRYCVWFGTTQAEDFAKQIRAQTGAYALIVIANEATYGGCANERMSTMTLAPGASDATINERVRVTAHELGHALIGLGDEYDTGTCANFLPAANLATTQPVPWADLIAPGTPFPTAVYGAPVWNFPPTFVGTFEGAGYCQTGHYRPSPVCLMRDLNYGPCPVCQREHARMFNGWLDPNTYDVEPNDTKATAQYVGNNTTLRGTIRLDNGTLDNDYFRFDVPYGECGLVRLQPNSVSDYNLTVMDSNQRILKSSQKGVGLTDSALVCGTSPLFIRVLYASGAKGAAGWYTMTFLY